MNRALYLIGFSNKQLILSDDLAWLSVSGVECCDHQSVRFWCKAMDRRDFEGPEAERNLANLEWLTPIVLAHDAAVSALSSQAPFYPARFGTLFSSEERIFELIDAVEPTLLAFLDSLGKRREWGVKCFVNWSNATTAYALDHDGDEIPSPTTGTNYLKARQMKKVRDAAIQAWMTEKLEVVRNYLQTQFADVVERSIPKNPDDDKVDKEDREWVGNFALLASEDQASDLLSVLAETGQPEIFRTTVQAIELLSFEMTGPWPAYSLSPSLVPEAESGE